MKWLPSLSFSVDKSDQILEMWRLPLAIPKGLHPTNVLRMWLMLANRLEVLRNNGVGFALFCFAFVPTPNITGWQLEHSQKMGDVGYYIFTERRNSPCASCFLDRCNKDQGNVGNECCML